MTEVTIAIPDWPGWVWAAIAYGAGFVVTFMIGARVYEDEPATNYTSIGHPPPGEMIVFIIAMGWPVALFIICMALPFVGLWRLARIGKK